MSIGFFPNCLPTKATKPIEIIEMGNDVRQTRANSQPFTKASISEAINEAW